MRIWGRVSVFLLAMVGGLLLAPAMAQAEPVAGTPSDLIPVQWDGPTTNLAWDSSTYATSEGTFVGSPVSVPGDRAERRALITNAGPSNATATVEIRNITTTNATNTVNTGLEEIIHLFWDINGHQGDEVWQDARLAANADNVSYTVSFPVARGEQFPITVGFYFPIDATGGMNQGATSSTLSFDIRITLQGQTPTTTTPNTPTHIPTGGTSVLPNGLAAPLWSGWWLLALTSAAIGWSRLKHSRTNP